MQLFQAQQHRNFTDSLHIDLIPRVSPLLPKEAKAVRANGSLPLLLKAGTTRSELHLPQDVKLQSPCRQEAERTTDQYGSLESSVPPPLGLLRLDAVVK